MTNRAALIDDTGTVSNIAIFEDWFNEASWNGLKIVFVADDLHLSPGWTYSNGEFVPPPVNGLYAPQTAKLSEKILANYTNTYPDTPANVLFTVNGATTTVALTSGVAELEITPSAIGPITVSVDQPVDSVVINVEAG
jgi:hypothetical protein